MHEINVLHALAFIMHGGLSLHSMAHFRTTMCAVCDVTWRAVQVENSDFL